MYDRTVEGKTLTFAVSGLLWRNSLVMIDRETHSLWSHLLGEAMRGPLQGKRLEAIPSVMTDWKSWQSRYPQTTCLLMSRTADVYVRSALVGDDELVIGLVVNGRARAWPLQELRNNPVVNDHFAGIDVLVAYDEQSGTAVLHGRKVNNRVLTFRLEQGGLFDAETGTQWDLISATGLSGPLKGETLERLNGMISLDFAWRAFHPGSLYWKSSAQDDGEKTGS